MRICYNTQSMNSQDTFEHLSGQFSARDIGLGWISTVTILNVSKAISTQPHSHAYMELVFCLKGELVYELADNTQIRLSAGTGIVFPAHMRHALKGRTESPNERMGFHIMRKMSPQRSYAVFDAKDYRNFYTALLRKAATPFRLNPTAFRHAKELAGFIKQPSKRLSSAEHGLVRILCCMILYQTIASLSQAPADSQPQLMNEAKSFFEAHYAEPLRIEQLIRHIGYSRSRFFALFKNHTGLSPNDYLIRLRIRKSEELLRTTSRSIAQVAADVGLPNTTYFSTVFKRYIGRTPTDYRLNPWAKGSVYASLYMPSLRS